MTIIPLDFHNCNFSISNYSCKFLWNYGLVVDICKIQQDLQIPWLSLQSRVFSFKSTNEFEAMLVNKFPDVILPHHDNCPVNYDVIIQLPTHQSVHVHNTFLQKNLSAIATSNWTMKFPENVQGLHLQDDVPYFWCYQQMTVLVGWAGYLITCLRIGHLYFPVHC